MKTFFFEFIIKEYQVIALCKIIKIVRKSHTHTHTHETYVIGIRNCCVSHILNKIKYNNIIKKYCRKKQKNKI